MAAIGAVPQNTSPDPLDLLVIPDDRLPSPTRLQSQLPAHNPRSPRSGRMLVVRATKKFLDRGQAGPGHLQRALVGTAHPW
jgi:hypothetical protein